MDVEFRLATIDDLDELVRLDDLAFGGETHSPLDRTGRRQFRHLLTAAHAEVYVAQRDGRIIGFAEVLMRRGSSVVRGYSLAMAPEERNAGVATRFFAWAERRWREQGFDRMSTEVHVNNVDAQRLYERLGYRVTERMPDYFGPGDDGLRMVKHLTAE